MATKMLAPNAYQSFQTRGGSYASDANKVVSGVAANDVMDMINSGCVPMMPNLQGRDNFASAGAPGTTSDTTQGYAIGSRWIDTNTGLLWTCTDATTNAAVWRPAVPLIGRLIGANMNATTDQAIPLFVPATAAYKVAKITVTNASANLTTAVGGFYTATSKGGVALVANTQVYTALSTAGKSLDVTLAAAAAITNAAATPLYLSLTTAQGTAATADVYVFGDPVF
jgi:Tfp pilus assembly protein PilV